MSIHYTIFNFWLSTYNRENVIKHIYIAKYNIKENVIKILKI